MPLGHPGQLLTMPTVQPRSLLRLATTVSLLDIAHAMAQDADVRAGIGLGRSPCHRSPSVLWRLACELAPSPHLPLPPGHRDLADVALRWRAADSQASPSIQDYVGPLYDARLRLVPSFATASALQLRMAAMDDLRPPSCCSTTECLGFLFHLAPICCTASSLSSFSLSSLLTRDRQR